MFRDSWPKSHPLEPRTPVYHIMWFPPPPRAWDKEGSFKVCFVHILKSFSQTHINKHRIFHEKFIIRLFFICAFFLFCICITTSLLEQFHILSSFVLPLIFGQIMTNKAIINCPSKQWNGAGTNVMVNVKHWWRAEIWDEKKKILNVK